MRLLGEAEESIQESSCRPEFRTSPGDHGIVVNEAWVP